MSLKSKIVIVLAILVLAYAVGDHVLQRRLLLPSFERLEQHESAKAIERAQGVVRDEQQRLARQCQLWSQRLSESGLAAGSDPAALAQLLGHDLFELESLQLVMLCDGERAERKDIDVLVGAIRSAEDGAAIRLREFPTGTIAANHWIFSPQQPSASVAGLVSTERGLLMVAAQPLPAAAPELHSAPRLVIGRFLGAEAMQQLSQHAGTELAAWPIQSNELPAEERAMLDDLTAGTAEPFRADGERAIYAYAMLPDARRQPAILLRAAMPRDIYSHGHEVVRYALISTITAGGLMVLVLLVLLERIVLRPVADLTRHALEIGRSDDLTRRLVIERSDEIGVLSREFDAMVGKLASSREAVVDAARAAGMSEIATGILHNVGNVLNSVNVSSGLIQSKLQSSKVPLLQRLAAVVGEQGERLGTWVQTDPQGRQMAPFLGALSRQIGEEHVALGEESASLVRGLEHVRQLVDAQQAFATKSTLREPTVIAAQIEAALRLTEGVRGGAEGIEIVRNFESLPSVRTDRHKLLEILVNVIQNARQAVAAGKAAQPRIELKLERSASGRLRIEVRDNGEGIEAQNLERIFNHGFTTKQGGHGFGLHASANAAKSLGGELSASSAGPGQGAVFALEFPIEEALAHAA